MPYKAETTWNDWARVLEQQSNRVLEATQMAESRACAEWKAYVSNKDDATLAADLGRGVEAIQEMRAAFDALHAINEYAAAASAALRKFT